MTLGEQLKTLRQKTGFSQELVAERLGVSRQSVTKWERGQTVPTAEIFWPWPGSTRCPWRR